MTFDLKLRSKVTWRIFHDRQMNKDRQNPFDPRISRIDLSVPNISQIIDFQPQTEIHVGLYPGVVQHILENLHKKNLQISPRWQETRKPSVKRHGCRWYPVSGLIMSYFMQEMSEILLKFLLP